RKAEREMIKMENLKQQLETAMLEIHIRAGEGGRLYGAVTSREIADQIKAQLGLEIDRRQIELSEPIHTAGIHSVPISLHHGITANLRVRIIPQTAEGGH
ncbi:MAG TPA: 50S ribosomal protein L9, partial [Armatimonadetes bacterium]|nr:50S ribosomal protein L9 [Armatimonadota bacterium]